MKKQNFLPKIIVAFKNMSYLCSINFEAIHNKDYSVVKAFKAGLFRVSLFLYYLLY